MSNKNPMTPEQQHKCWQERVSRKIVRQVVELNKDYREIIDIMKHMGIDESRIGLAAQQISWGWDQLSKLVRNSKPRKEN